MRRPGFAHAAGPGPGGPWLDLLVDGLATYRLTRLATADIISEPARLAVLRRLRGDTGPEDVTAVELVESLDDPPPLATLITCRWCAGVWIAAGVAAARLMAPKVWDPAARALALAASAALLARLETD
jgi:hypothetical protein